MITGNGWNLSTAGFANALEGWNNQEDRRDKKRLEQRQEMALMADMLANQGVQMGMDDWAKYVSSQMTPGDFLSSTAPTSEVSNMILSAQNAKAARNDEDRQRSTFRAKLEDNKLIEDEIAKRSLSGEKPEEIAVALTETFGERAKDFVPRVGAISNQSVLNERLKTEQAYADTFEDEAQAQEFIKSNPGFTKAAQEGLLNAGRKAAARREDKIHSDAVAVAARIGDSMGAVDEATVRTAVKAFIPPSAKPEYEQKVMEKVWGMAKAAEQVKRAGLAVQSNIDATKVWQQNAPTIAREMAVLQTAEANDLEQRRQRFIEQQSTRGAGVDALLKDLEAQAVKAGDTKQQGVIAEVRQIVGTYAVADIDGLMDAVRNGNKAKIESIKKISPTRSEEQSRINAGGAFLRGPAFQSKSEMLGALDPLLPSDKKFETLGAHYKSLLDAAIPGNQNLPEGAKVDANGRVWVPNIILGAKVGWKEHSSQASTKEAESNALNAGIARQRFIDDLSGRVISGVQGVITQSGRIDMSPEEMGVLSEQLARRYVTAFLRGSGAGSVGKESIDALTAEVLQKAGTPVGATRRVSPVDAYISNLRGMAGDAGVLPGSFATPGSVLPSARATTVAPHSGGVAPSGGAAYAPSPVSSASPVSLGGNAPPRTSGRGDPPAGSALLSDPTMSPMQRVTELQSQFEAALQLHAENPTRESEQIVQALEYQLSAARKALILGAGAGRGLTNPGDMNTKEGVNQGGGAGRGFVSPGGANTKAGEQSAPQAAGRNPFSFGPQITYPPYDERPSIYRW